MNIQKRINYKFKKLILHTDEFKKFLSIQHENGNLSARSEIIYSLFSEQQFK